MKKIPLSELRQDLVREFEASGGVVEYFVYEVGDESDPQLEAARLTLIELDQTEPDPNLLGHGRRITLADFLGPWVDPEKPQLLFSAAGTDRLVRHDHPDLEQEGSRSWSGSMMKGYGYAFGAPPYTLQGSPRDRSILFSDIFTFFFGSFEDDYLIRTWNTARSDYFEPGHEWWWAFLWSVRRKGGSEVVIVAASSTD